MAIHVIKGSDYFTLCLGEKALAEFDRVFKEYVNNQQKPFIVVKKGIIRELTNEKKNKKEE